MQDIPVIDMRGLGSDPAADQALVAACSGPGLFHAVGHGIAPAQQAALLAAARAFFTLPAAQKQAVERSADNPWGFYDRELTKNRRDLKEVFDLGPPEAAGSGTPLAGAAPRWPASPAGFRAALEAWVAACEGLSTRLLAAIAQSLGVPAARLQEAFAPAHTGFLRLNHYPVQRAAEGLGIHPHTDAGVLTVLLQDGPPALEVAVDGRWVLVEPPAGALTVNIGDVVQVWSNDRYHAPLHRVQPSTAAVRYSAAWFHNPAYRADYAPLPEACAGAAPRYRPINWGAFRAARAAGDYADLGEEVQVDQYRLA